MPIDTSYMLGARGIETPDPTKLFAQGVTLASLARQNRLDDLSERKLAQDERARQALNRVLPEVAAAGYTEDAYRKAVQSAPEVAAPLFKFLDERRKANADFDKTTAETASKTGELKLKNAAALSNEARWLSENPNLSADQIGSFMKKVAANGLEDIITPIPFQAWTKPDTARQALAAASNLFYDAKDAISHRETGRHNLATEGNAAATLDQTRVRDTNTNTYQMGNLARMSEANRVAAANVQATRDATAATRTDAQTQAYAKMIDSTALPNLMTSANALNSTLAKYAQGGEIPGVGMVESRLPAFLQSAEGNAVRSQIQAVSNDLLKLYSGGAVTANEAERRAAEMMASGNFNADDLRRAWPLVVGRINAAAQNARAGFSPDAVRTYEQRGGMRLSPIEPPTPPSTGAAPGGAPARSVLTPTGQGTYRYGF